MKNIFWLLAIVEILITSIAYPQWIEQTLPGDVNISLGIDFINQDHGVTGGWHFNIAAQIFGNAFYTTDSGTSWIEATIPDSMRVMVDVQMFDGLIAYGVGAYNKTGARSQTNSNNNQNLNSQTRKYYEQIGWDFSGQENYRGYFVETTDGGLSWHPKGSFNDSVYYLVGIYFLDQQTGYVIANSETVSNSAVLKTTDGGNTWNYEIPFQYQAHFRDIRFFSQIGYLIYENSVSGSVFITTTTDGGMTWSVPIEIGMSSASKIAYVNEYTILIGGRNNQFEGSVFRSTDAGISWQEIRNYDYLNFVNGVDVVWNTNVILVYGSYQPTGGAIPFVDVSLDAGNTWNYSQLLQFQDHSTFYSKMVDEQRWYLTGAQTLSQGFVLFTDNAGGVPVELVSFTAESVDNGVQIKWTTASELNNLGFEIERRTDDENWRTIGFVEGKGTTTEIQNYYYADDLYGVNESKFYYRLKQIDFNGKYEYSDEVEVIKIPSSFSLEQNYPNPFNPSTKIKFTIPTPPSSSPLVKGRNEVGFVTLKVYDVLGNEIATLVNEEKLAGEYEVEFNTSSINHHPSSGIYFYQLNSGEFIQTKKMLMIK